MHAPYITLIVLVRLELSLTQLEHQYDKNERGITLYNRFLLLSHTPHQFKVILPR